VASPITGPAGNHEYLLWLGSTLAVEGTAAAAAGLESAVQATDGVETLERATAGFETAESGDGATEPAENKSAKHKSAENKSAENKSAENKNGEGQEADLPAAPGAVFADPQGSLTQAPAPTTAHGETPQTLSSPTNPLTNPLQSPSAQPQVGGTIRASSGTNNQACLASAGGLDRRAIRALVDQTLASP
jgi:hypothetical protein